VLPGVPRHRERFDGGSLRSTRGGDGLLDVAEEYDVNPVQESILAGGDWRSVCRLNEDYNDGEV
jgi:choline dehydrogenase